MVSTTAALKQRIALVRERTGATRLWNRLHEERKAIGARRVLTRRRKLELEADIRILESNKVILQEEEYMFRKHTTL